MLLLAWAAEAGLFRCCDFGDLACFSLPVAVIVLFLEAFIRNAGRMVLRCMTLRTLSMQWKSLRRDVRRGLFVCCFPTSVELTGFCFRIQMRIWFCREMLSIWIDNIVVVQKERNLRI